MNNIKKMMSHFLVLGLLAGGSFSAAAYLGARSLEPASAAGQPAQSQLKPAEKEYAAADFADEVEANSEELGVAIAQNTLTETSQSFNITFRSKTLIGFKTSRGNYVVQITDPNFTGDVQNPAPEGYDRYDEETSLPVFTGVVSFVIGGSGQNADVCLPSTLTRDGSFVIDVEGITTGCVTATGAEYNNKNTWGPSIKNIYIPDTMKYAEAGAFTGVPTDDSVKIHFEGTSLPAGFDASWTDAQASALDISANNYKTKSLKKANVGGTVDDIQDALGRPINFILGCQEDANHQGDVYNRPLIVQYDRVTVVDGVEKNRVTHYDELALTNTANNPFDSCGKISALNYTRLLDFKLGENERIDGESIVFHNIMKASATSVIDTTQRYFAKPESLAEIQDINNLVHYKASINSTFAGYSNFSLKMDKNLSITSHKYPEPHSLYLDVKQDMYEQNLSKIQAGTTKIRYSLYNLYNSSFCFEYIGSGGELKRVEIPVKTTVSYQILEQNKGNDVSVLLKNSAIAPDFSPDKVQTFELKNITIQMDLLTTSDSGSTSVLAKSAISYKFAYITVFANKKVSVFNWNLFLIIFFVAYVVVYAAAAFGMYKFLKEKFKNDEFRRVNGKKFVRSAALGGLGLGIVVAAILFIIMRVGPFKSTIVVFNPTDPLLIGFSIAALIIIGYFIVYVVKLVKAERERRKIIRLKLAEDVEDDGTN